MEKYEKIANSKVFRFLEYLYKLIILNMVTFLTIVLTLGLTLMPALTAMFVIIKGMKEQEEFPIVSTYFRAYANVFKKMIVIEILFFAFFALYSFNIYYFYEMVQEYQGLYNEIAYYVCLIILVIFIIAFINSCIVCVYFPHLSRKKNIKYSFVLLKVTALKALVMFAIMMGFIFLGVLVLFAVPFVLLSVYGYIYIELVHSDYSKLLPSGYRSLHALDYEIKSREKKMRK